MMTLADKLRMLEEMRKIASGMRYRHSGGICENVAFGVGYPYLRTNPQYVYFRTIMLRSCKSWAHFSGSTDYPVDHPVTQRSHHAFWEYPCWEGEYGRRRYELCDRIIKEIKRDLSKNHRSQRRSHQLGKKKRK